MYIENDISFDKNKLQDAINHFKSLQKRYTSQHNGKMCERTEVALSTMQARLDYLNSDNKR